MTPIISIIIPCFNSEATLEGTLNSVLEQEFQNWEAIIVNDGSTDKTEQIALNWVEKDKRFIYFSKQNEGLGKTRNYGILRAKGEYILPLDSDNQVEKDFVITAVEIFHENPQVGVVHGNAEYFGAKKGVWEIGEFNLEKILIGNYIDACAIFKKEIIDKIGGYDTQMPYQGHEDWDLWITMGVLNVKFFYIKKVTFKYFVDEKSMIRSFSHEMLMINQDYIVRKYARLYHKYYELNLPEFKKIEKEYLLKMKSKKNVLNLFCSTFFGFKVFKVNPK